MALDRGSKEYSFVGLNEAVTEMLAQEVRKRFVVKNDFMSPEDKNWLKESVVYLPHILVLDKLIDYLAGGEVGERQRLKNEIFKNFVLGQFSFLKKLSQKKKGAVQTLLKMGDRYDDALVAAGRLDFKDVEDKIIEFLKKRQR